MPTVPQEFVPGVALQPTQTPRASGAFVAPMQNQQPALMERLGQTSEKAGAQMVATGQTIGDRVQETMDDALTKNAETQFLAQSSAIVDGYTRKLGQEAIDGYDPATEAVVKAKADAEGSLTNDIQRRMFNYVAATHLTNVGKTMSDHQYQQTVKYGADAANDRADSMVQQAANSYSDWQRPDGDYARYRSQAIQETQHGAALLGLPPDSANAKAVVKQKTTELAQGVLTRMMDSEQYDEAKEYYKQALDAGEIDERVAESLGTHVMEGHNTQKGKDLATAAKQVALAVPGAKGPVDRQPVDGQPVTPDVTAAAPDAAVPEGGGDEEKVPPAVKTKAPDPSTFQQRISPIPGSAITTDASSVRVTDTMGSPRPGGRVHNGIDIAVPVGTQVQAPANGTVSKVWTDDKFGGGLSMEISYPNGSTEGFAHLSAVNYKPGQQVTQGATLALTGKTGNATGPSLHWAMKDPDGQWVDPRAQSPVAKNPSDFTDPDMLQRGMDYINATDSTQRVKDSAINQLKSDYGTAREIENQRYQKVKEQVVDILDQNAGNLSAVPANLRSALHPSDLYAFQKDYDETSRKNNEVAQRAFWIENPALQTVPAVKEAYQKGMLTNSGYLTTLREAVDQQDPEKVRAVSVDNDQIKATLINNHLPQVANPEMGSNKTEKDALQSQQVLLYNHIRDVISAEQDQTKKPLDRDRKQQIIDQAVMDQIHIGDPGDTSGKGGGSQFTWQVQPQQMSNAYITLHNGQRVNPSYIPPQVLGNIMAELRKYGLPPTQYNIANRWDQLGRPLR